MAAIPRQDITIVLRDAGYALAFVEGDSSTTLAQFGIGIIEGSTTSIGRGGSGNNVANFPAYNSLNSPQTPPYRNEELGASAAIGHATSTAGPFPVNPQTVFDGALWWVLDIGNINPGGVLPVKTEAWPGILNVNSTGLNTLNITNPDAHAVYSIFPALLGLPGGPTPGLIVSALNIVSGVDELLAITAAMAAGSGDPTTWVSDPSPIGALGTQSASHPITSLGLNVQATLSASPTIAWFILVYDLNNPVLNPILAPLGTGDLPPDPLNAFDPPSFPGQQLYYFEDTASGQVGIFGIDYDAAGTNSGCWYTNIEATAYGSVSFTMPDASIGPSGDPSVYWVFNVNTGGAVPSPGPTFRVFPQWDLAGKVWWLRLPLVDGGGNMVIEPLTGEVYTSGAAATGAGIFAGTFVGFFQAGKFGGGTK